MIFYENRLLAEDSHGIYLIFFRKFVIWKDVAKFVVCCSCDWRFKGISEFHSSKGGQVRSKFGTNTDLFSVFQLAEKKKRKSHKKYSDFNELPRPKSSQGSTDTKISSSPRYNGEVEVTTTIKSRGPGSGVVRVRPTSAREISLNVLRDMKKLQTTLRKDDLSWE